jgi:hypothetical protein
MIHLSNVEISLKLRKFYNGIGDNMTRTEKVKIRQNKNSQTQYITVPSYMVMDSSYPFANNEEVSVEIVSKEEGLLIRKLKAESSQ